mmetsp:Transcript_17720/g.55258  ORF Transcript_17720/g.55258 Transcript_17720/m.55258 type:complete len:291 (-) Transcript_17720:35-907(-)
MHRHRPVRHVGARLSSRLSALGRCDERCTDGPVSLRRRPDGPLPHRGSRRPKLPRGLPVRRCHALSGSAHGPRLRVLAHALASDRLSRHGADRGLHRRPPGERYATLRDPQPRSAGRLFCKRTLLPLGEWLHGLGANHDAPVHRTHRPRLLQLLGLEQLEGLARRLAAAAHPRARAAGQPKKKTAGRLGLWQPKHLHPRQPAVPEGLGAGAVCVHGRSMDAEEQRLVWHLRVAAALHRPAKRVEGARPVARLLAARQRHLPVWSAPRAELVCVCDLRAHDFYIGSSKARF